MFTFYMIHWTNREAHYAGWWGALAGVIIASGLIALYSITVTITTSDERLRSIK